MRLNGLKVTPILVISFFIFFLMYLTIIESLSYAFGILHLLLIFHLLALFYPFQLKGASSERVYLYRKIFAVFSCSLLAIASYFIPQLFRQYWSILFLLTPFIFISRSQRQNWRDPLFWKVEGYFFTLFASSLILLSLSPEWGSGEKPMDLNFLNYYSRPGALTHFDPWFAGEKSSYYTFGFALSGIWAVSSRLSGNEFYLPALSLWLTIFLMSLMLLGAKKRIVGLIFFALPLGASLQVFSSLENFSFSKFWQMTRVYTHPYFSEFPLWSYLFYDLHPHVMAYSFCALLFAYFIDFKDHQLKGGHPYIFGALFVLLLLTSFWDFIFWGVTFLILSLCFIKRIPLKSALIAAIVIFSGGIAYLLLNPGQQKITFAFWSLNDWISQIASGLFLQHSLLLLLLIYLSIKKKSLIALPVLIISLFFSFFILMDPVNSIFKFQTSFTVLLMLFNILLLKDARPMKKLTLGVCLFITFTTALTFFHRRPEISQSYLSSLIFLEKTKPDVARLAKFLADEKYTSKTLVEAVSDSFTYSGSLLSTYTGIASYLGWKNHVRIRGVDSQKILQRSHIISQIYLSQKTDEIVGLLKREGIDLIVLGEKERRQYRGGGLGKFVNHPEYFEHLFSSETIHLFKLR